MLIGKFSKVRVYIPISLQECILIEQCAVILPTYWVHFGHIIGYDFQITIHQNERMGERK